MERPKRRMRKPWVKRPTSWVQTPIAKCVDSGAACEELADVVPEVACLDRRRDLVFYRIVLPLLTLANVLLAAVVATSLRPNGWLDWVAMGTAGFCCAVAGWLAASLWSKSYWAQVIARQVAAWRRMADTMLAWIEELPISNEALDGLRRSLEEASTR